jgi:hypothetical protein
MAIVDSSNQELRMQHGDEIIVQKMTALYAADGDSLRIRMRENASFRFTPAMYGTVDRPQGDEFLTPLRGALVRGNVSFNVRGTMPGAASLYTYCTANDEVDGEKRLYQITVKMYNKPGGTVGRQLVFDRCHTPAGQVQAGFTESSERDMHAYAWTVSQEGPTETALPGA